MALQIKCGAKTHFKEGVEALQIILNHLARRARRLFRNLTDLLSKPIPRHTRRLIASMSLFGETILSREWLAR